MSEPEGTKTNPWKLSTPSGSSQYEMHQDGDALICVVGSTKLSYQFRAIEDLHAMLKAHGDWMLLGSADEQKPAAEGTVEAWARDESNPVEGWYGTKKGLRGRFGMYMPPSWSGWAWPRSNTTRATTGCVRGSLHTQRTGPGIFPAPFVVRVAAVTTARWPT